jgi:5-deoxy-glucuronate isomerase
VSWHHPWLSLAGPESGDVVVLTPEMAGWDYCGLHVVRLEPGEMRTVETGDFELFVLPLSGGLTIEVAATAAPGATEIRQAITGRSSVFARVTDFAYVGRDSLIRLISAQGAEVALPAARCQNRRPPKYAAAEQVAVETRGSGPSTRQVNNFGSPDAWPHAEKLVAVEVLTPAGNWSSYPPHKHDTSEGCPAVNEEIYFFRIGGPDGVTPSREGFGLQRAYTGPEHEKAGLADVDQMVEVRDCDVFVLPYGYHGPSVAAPGYPMYYLNVLAGPGEQRSMAFCDDPMHGWVRDSWAGMPLDPRCPMTSAEGPTS